MIGTAIMGLVHRGGVAWIDGAAAPLVASVLDADPRLDGAHPCRTVRVRVDAAERPRPLDGPELPGPDAGVHLPCPGSGSVAGGPERPEGGGGVMDCPRCQLPDNYHGEGDGIGSCDCSRCDCCGAGPVDDCECRMDWDESWDDDETEFDPFCNDEACPWRAARIDRARNKAEATS